MNQNKGRNSSQSSKKVKLFDPPLILLLGVSALAYYLVWAAIYALLGERVASWLSTPLWGIPLFFITRWDRIRTQQGIGWRDYIKHPQLSLRKLIIILLTIFFIQFVAGFIAEKYVEMARPELITDEFLESFSNLFSVREVQVIIRVSYVLSFVVGGYVAGKLSPYMFQVPYSHAAVGTFIFVLIGQIIMGVFLLCACGTRPTQEDIGWFALSLPPTILLATFGAWVRVGNRAWLVRSIKNWLTSLRGTPEGNTDSGPAEVDILSSRNAANVKTNKGLQFRTLIRRRGKRRKRKR